MSVTYRTVDGDLATPKSVENDLQRYHPKISQTVDVDVVGVTGINGGIRRVVLSAKTDVSDLEDWLGSALVIDQ